MVILRIALDQGVHIGLNARGGRHSRTLRVEVALVQLIEGRARLIVIERALTVPHSKVIAHDQRIAGVVTDRVSASGAGLTTAKLAAASTPQPACALNLDRFLVRKGACGLTEILARELRDRGRQVEIEHLHTHLPRVLKAPADTRTTHPEQETTR